MTAELLNKYQDHAFLFFRVVFGIVFTLHGLYKFGVFGGSAVPMPTTLSFTVVNLMYVASWMEVIMGPLLVLGLLTRFVSVLGIIEMFVALLTVHWKGGNFNPLLNNGEAATLFFVAFVVFLAFGAGKFSLDRNISALKKIA